MTDIQHFTADDGARTAYRDEGQGLPLLCLPGLTRSMADFDYLIPHLPPLRLIRMDYRRRGQSDWTGAATPTPSHKDPDALALPRPPRRGAGDDPRHLARRPDRNAPRRHRPRPHRRPDPERRRPRNRRRRPVRIFDYVGLLGRKDHRRLRRASLPHTRLRKRADVALAGGSPQACAETPDGLRIPYDPALRATPSCRPSKGPPVDLWPLFDTLQGACPSR